MNIPYSHFGLCFLATLFLSLILKQLSEMKPNNITNRLAGQRQQHWIHKSKAIRGGGIAILIVLISHVIVTGEFRSHLAITILSAVPVFFTGMLEDIGLGASPKIRYLAALLSAFLALLIFSTWVTSVRVPVIDNLLLIPTVAICFTVILASSLSHCFNLIDGIDGLASGIAMAALAGLAILGFQQSDGQLATSTLIIISCLAGFFLVNITTGKIFLGDAGAYFIGHIIAWTAIITNDTVWSISPWAMLLLVIYPVSEMLTTIYRRLMSNKKIAEPDNQHLHHLLYHRLCKSFPTIRSKLTKIVTTLILLSSAIIPIIFALTFPNNSTLCFLVSVLFLLAFFTFHLRLSKAM